jgi:hypothetical protein
MITGETNLDGFELRLLGELRRVVSERASAPAVSAPAPRRFGRRSLALAGGVAVAAGIAVVVGLSVGDGGGPEKAYAVTSNPDGSVTVKINSLRDSAGLERKLNEAGVPALVQYLPPGKTCVGTDVGPGAPATASRPPLGVRTVEKSTDRGGINEAGGPVLHTEGAPPKGAPNAPAMTTGMRVNGDGSVEFTVDAPDLGDHTLVIRNQDSGPTSVGVSLADGQPKPCKLVDAGN